MFETLSKLTDSLSGGIISYLKHQAKNSTSYQKIQQKLNPNGYAEQVKQLLDRAINFSVSEVKQDVEVKYLKENIEVNKELIYSWIIFSDQPSFLTEEDKLTILYPDYEKSIKRFFKTIFYQIMQNKDNYSHVLNLQIKNEIQHLKQDHSTIINQNNELDKKMDALMLLAEQAIKPSWDFASVLDNIENKLKNRNTTSAIQIALSIEPQVIESTNNEEKEKFYQLIVNSYILDTSNQHKAVPFLEKLILFTSESEKQKQREILLLLLKKDFNNTQKEIDKVIGKHFHDDTIKQKIYDLQINLYFIKKKYDEAIIFLDKVKDKFKDYLFWYAEIYILTNKFDKIISLYEENKDYFDNEDFRIKKIKFELLISYYIEEIKKNNNIITNGDKLKELLIIADSLIVSSGDDNFVKSTLHCQKAYILGFLGNNTESEVEYIKAENFFNENPLLLRNYPIILLHSKDLTKANKGIKLLKKYIDIYPSDYLSLSLFFDHLIKIDTQKAIDKLKELQECDEIPVFIKTKIITALNEGFKRNEALKYLDIFSKKYKDNCFVDLVHAQYYQKSKDIDLAISKYEASLKNSLPEPFRLYAILNITRIYFNKNHEEDYKKALDLLTLYYPEAFFLYNLTEQYVQCLYKLNRFTECIEFCNKLKINGLLNSYIIRYLASCYMITQNYSLALEEYNKLKDSGDFENSDLVNYASCNLSLGMPNQAEDILEYLDDPKTESDYLNLSRFYFLLNNMDKALEYIDKGYKSYPNDREIMEQFITYVLQFKIKPNSEKIIQNYHDCLKNYNNSSFENKMLYSFTVPKEPTANFLESKIKELLGPKNETESKINIYKKFQKKKLPLSFIQSLDHKNYVYLWQQYLTNDNYIFHSFHGNNKDKEEYPFADTNKIFIDVSCLLLLDKMNLLSTLEKLYNTIYITQSIFDIFQNSLIDKNNNFLSPSYLDFTTEIEDDYKLYPKGHYTSAWDLAEKMIDTITNSDKYCLIGLPINTKNKVPERLVTLRNEVEEKYDFDCLLSSYNMSIPILYDNVLIRELYNSLDNSPGSFSLVIVLQKMLELENWSAEEYYNHISQLVKYNYKYILITHQLMMHNLVFENYIINENNIPIFNLMTDLAYNKNGILYIYENILTTIWKEDMFIETKIEINEYFKELLKKRRDISDKNICDSHIKVSNSIKQIVTKQVFRDRIVNS